MYFKVSWDDEFDALMMHLWSKYGKEMFTVDGIGEQMDLHKFSKKFFNDATTTADASVDANANVSQRTSIEYNFEMPKPLRRYNSYFCLWKQLRKDFGLELANKIIEAQLNGEIYVNDFTDVNMPYSYHPGTTIIVSTGFGKLGQYSMKQLFDEFQIYAVRRADWDEIDMKPFGYRILVDGGSGSFTELTRLVRHKSSKDLLRIETKRGDIKVVTTDHPCLLADGREIEARNLVVGDKLIGKGRYGSKLRERHSLPVKVSTNRAYVIGAMVGDGAVNRDNCTFYQNDAMSSSYASKFIAEFGHITESNEGRSFTFGNTVVSDWFKREIGRNSVERRLPAEFLMWSEDSVAALVAGVIDTDGCVNKHTGVIDIRVSSLTLVQQVSEAAHILGFSRIRTSLMKNYQKGDERILTKNPLYRVSFVISEDHPIIEMSYKLSSNRDKILRARGKDGRFETDEILKIEVLPYVGEYVYDITTETGRFQTSGLEVHNCFNYSTNDIKYDGLKGLSDRPYVTAPKSLDVFIRQIEQFMVVAANSTLGATGFSDALIVASTYVDKIIETGRDGHINIGKNIDDIKTYVKEKLTEFIYTVNWSFRGNQSPFSNLSVYDDTFLDHLCPDYGANKETVKMLQEIYLDAMNEEMARTPLTFPVTTACFCTDEDNNIKDKEFAKFIAEKNLKYGFINIYNGKTTNLSSCCFDGKQKVWIKRGEVPRQVTFETLKKMSEKHKYVEAYNGTEWAKAKLVELPARDMYVVFTENHNSLFCTDNHVHVLENSEEKITTELCVGDSLKHVHLGGDKIVYVGKVEDYDKPTVFCLEMVDESKPYFELGNGIITHNCRLRSSTDNPYFNTFGAGSTKIGSLGVVTVSFPRAAMKAVDKADASLDPELKEQYFMENLHDLFDMECMINSAKRKLISKRIDLGAAPLYTHGYMALSKQYSTFGIVGLNEAVEIMGYDILTKEGQAFVSRVLDTINEWVLSAENQYRAPHNVEQVPSEGSAVKLATKDKMMGYDCGVPFYSNQFIPLVTQANMLDRIRLQGMFDAKMSGGAICHINVAEEITDPDKMVKLMEYAAKCGVVYWAVNYRIRMCENHHTWVGTEKCPVCGKPYTDEITRVVGFFTNTKHWNKTRREHDWPNRQFYSSI